MEFISGAKVNMMEHVLDIPAQQVISQDKPLRLTLYVFIKSLIQ